jgi:O-antigen ligase
LDRLIVLAFLLSVTWLKFAPMVLAITFVWSLFQRRSAAEIKSRLFSLNSIALWSMLFFLYHIVGMAWSTNTKFGWSDIGMKASFLAVPLIVSIGNFSLNPKRFATILSFLLAIVVKGLLIYAAWKSWYYPEDNHWAYFFESEYSTFIHRSYWATYTAMASAWMLYMLLSENAKWKFPFVGVWFILSLSTFLTISKAGIIIWLVLTFTVFLQFVLRKKWWKLLSVGALGVVGLVCFLLFSNSRIASRFKEVPAAISSVKTVNNPSVESNTARIIMWSTSVKVIKENWLLGTGTGDVKDVLLAKNIQLKNTGAAERNLNAHNQFLNTWAQLGIAGFLLLIMLFVTTFRNAIKNKSVYGTLFAATMILTMLFESFVETQAGIVPFCLLLLLVNHRVDIKTT